MQALILCLYIAITVAWPSGVYILDGTAGSANQYYNPLAEPHSRLDLTIDFRANSYAVVQKSVAKVKYALLVVHEALVPLRDFASHLRLGAIAQKYLNRSPWTIGTANVSLLRVDRLSMNVSSQRRL